MNTVATYTAIYHKGTALPVALFLDGKDTDEWHLNPEAYTNCRRRVIISPGPERSEPAPKETEAERLLRILVTPGDHDLGNAIEAGQKLLKIK